MLGPRPAAAKAGAAFTRFAFPTWWYYNVLRALDYLRDAGVAPDARVAEAIEVAASKRTSDGRWLLETRYPSVMPIEIDDGADRPSRWITLRASWHGPPRVLDDNDREGRGDPYDLGLELVRELRPGPLRHLLAEIHRRTAWGEEQLGEALRFH